MNNNIIKDVMKLSSEEKLKLYYALQEELEENNLLEEEVQEINSRLDDINSGNVKTISEQEHLKSIEQLDKDA